MMEADLRLRVVVRAPVAREAAHHTTPLRPITPLVAATSSKATSS